MSIWADRAVALSQGISLDALEARAIAFLRDTQAGEPWLIGCSGGADSIALVCLFYAHFPERRGDFVLAHYNHALRGDDADCDAAFVAELAEGLRLGFRTEKASPSGAGISEACLRDMRMIFFDSVLKEREGRVLILGQQANDVAETLLMRLARGSGLTGLAAPRPLHVHRSGRVHVRPLLSLERGEIESRLSAAGIPWREDASNASQDYFRNRVRGRVLPLLQEVAPADLLPNMCLSRALLEEDEAALEAWLDVFFDAAAEGPRLRREPFVKKPKALYRRGLYRWLCDQGVMPSRSAFDAVLGAFWEGREGQWAVGKKHLIVLSDEVLRLKSVEGGIFWQPEGVLVLGGAVFFPNGASLAAERVSLNAEQLNGVLEGNVDACREAYVADLGDAHLRVRAWASGDRYWSLGAPGSRKLQDIFTDKKIPREQRACLPLIERTSSELVWCPGLPPAEKSRMESGMLSALRLTYLPSHD